VPGWLLVGLGGFLGSVLRYGASGLVHRLAPSTLFPLGTLSVNVLGSLLIGLLGGLAESRGILGPESRLLLLIGFLGGFTTFSTFAFETLGLMRAGQTTLVLGNVLGQVCLSLIAVWAGLVLSRLAGAVT